MTSSPAIRSLAMGSTALSLALLIDQPAQAHGIAHGGLAAGFLHPISGADHLLLLLAVGAAAAAITPRLLLAALAGAVGGALVGVTGGGLPGQEALAALAISLVALLVPLQLRSRPGSWIGGGAAALVAAGVALHAMLHGLEAPADGVALWWLGALAGSLLVAGGSFLVCRRLPSGWIQALALLLALAGGLAALGPIGLIRP